jgi:hypothetical protein
MLTFRASQGHVVTLEITSGQVYRGKLIEGASLYSKQSRVPIMGQKLMIDCS